MRNKKMKVQNRWRNAAMIFAGMLTGSYLLGFFHPPAAVQAMTAVMLMAAWLLSQDSRRSVSDYWSDSSELAAIIHDRLIHHGCSVAAAESITGGLLSGTLLTHGGSSAFLKEGVVTYCDAAKEQRLGVSPFILRTCSAVSRQCAESMALGVRRYAGADIGLSTTGYAGPATASEEVGLVYVAVAIGEQVFAEEKRYDYKKLGRDGIRWSVVHDALLLLLEHLPVPSASDHN